MLQCVHVDLIKYFAMDFYLLPVVPVQTDSTYTETHLLKKNYFFTVRTCASTALYFWGMGPGFPPIIIPTIYFIIDAVL